MTLSAAHTPRRSRSDGNVDTLLEDVARSRPKTERFGDSADLDRVFGDIPLRFSFHGLKTHLTHLLAELEAGTITPGDLDAETQTLLVQTSSRINSTIAPDPRPESLALDEVRAHVSETWKTRSDSKEPVVAFIKRVYAPFIDKGLTRKHLSVDPSLYTALANWLRKNDLPDWLDLPTAWEATPEITFTEEEQIGIRKYHALQARKQRAKIQK